MFDSHTNNEQELLLRLSKGDEAALEALLNNYAPVLAPFIYGFTKSMGRTEEIVQDIFMQVWLARESITAIANLKSFLYVAAKNQALNAVRSFIREQKRLEVYGQMQSNSIEDVPDSKLQWIEEAIALLPPQQQKVWLLNKREGKKYAEIAEMMQVSRETVKSYLQLANTSILKYIRQKVLESLTTLLFLHEILK